MPATAATAEGKNESKDRRGAAAKEGGKGTGTKTSTEERGAGEKVAGGEKRERKKLQDRQKERYDMAKMMGELNLD